MLANKISIYLLHTAHCVCINTVFFLSSKSLKVAVNVYK